MDQKGSLVDTHLKIFPSKKLVDFFNTLSDDNLPPNILKLKGMDSNKEIEIDNKELQLTAKDYENLNKFKDFVKEKYKNIEDGNEKSEEINSTSFVKATKDKKVNGKNNSKLLDESTDKKEANTKSKHSTNNKEDQYSNVDTDTEALSKDEEKIDKKEDPYILTADIDWLFTYLNELRKKDENTPFLHTLLEGCNIDMPENKVIKRNPILEARCVKLRAQQEAREYRKMTKTVDNVRMRFPEDSISYQLKQLNRQLIAIGQFLLSIFAGFLFGFRGVEWMVGNLDFGFRLLLGVMCALVIALAEIYFLAKKLNEELSVPETVQIGGPPKFAENSQCSNNYNLSKKIISKEHQD